MKSIEKEELHQIFEALKVNRQENIFNELYNKYRKLVYAIAFSMIKDKHDSEEIMQKVFLKIWSMEKEKLPVTNEASWLYSVTKNEAINFIKNKKEELNIEDLYYISNEEKELNKVVEADTYNRIIAKLSIQEQEIVSLKILSNLSFKEIAQALNEPVGTIKWRYYKSIHTLKILLSNLGMFLITFIIGLKSILSSSERNEKQVIENVINEENMREDEEHNEEKLEASFANKTIQDSVTNEEMKEEVIIPQRNKTNINYYGIGILGISSVFLITTIIFTIFFAKYQLKRKKKLSK